MPKTNAERQAAYRQRHLHDVDGSCERINVVVSLEAKFALARLASCYCITQRHVLERVLMRVQRDTLAQIPGQESAYYDQKLRFDQPVTA